MKFSFIFIALIFSLNTLAANPHVILETTSGDIEVELYPKKAPETVKNYLSYVKSNFYNKTIFHRVIDNFMIQGGGFSGDLEKKDTQDAIKNEADNGLENEVGTLAMARTSDPHSATAQFFINVSNNTFLNHKSKTPRGWGYCVFGKVVKGMSVVNKLKKVATRKNGPFQNLPVENIIIKKAYLKK